MTRMVRTTAMMANRLPQHRLVVAEELSASVSASAYFLSPLHLEEDASGILPSDGFSTSLRVDISWLTPMTCFFDMVVV